MTRSPELVGLLGHIDTGSRVIVGLVGAPGAGKSTLAAALARELTTGGTPAAVLPMDGFHLPQRRLRELGRRDRMGAPDTFDVDGFAAVLRAMRSPGAVVAPLFDREIEEPVPDALEIDPATRVVIAEGNYLLHDGDGWEGIQPVLDRVAYLEIDEALRRRRLIARHIAFGKTPDAADVWVAEVDDRNAALIERGRARADVIIRPS